MRAEALTGSKVQGVVATHVATGLVRKPVGKACISSGPPLFASHVIGAIASLILPPTFHPRFEETLDRLCARMPNAPYVRTMLIQEMPQ
jgi:hypothetical protein